MNVLIEAENKFMRAAATAATRWHGYQRVAMLHARLLSLGQLPLVPHLHLAARSMLSPAPNSCLTPEPLPIPPETPGIVALCAYMGLLLRACAAHAVALDEGFGENLVRCSRLVAIAAVVTPCSDAPLAAGATSAAVGVLQEAAGALNMDMARVQPALRLSLLPRDWLVDPTGDRKLGQGMPAERIWRNRQKLYDLVMGLQSEFVLGQPNQLCASVAVVSTQATHQQQQRHPRDVSEGAKELRALLVPENARWLAQFLTQRILQTCLGHEAALELPSPRDGKTTMTAASASAKPQAGHMHSLGRRMTARQAYSEGTAHAATTHGSGDGSGGNSGSSGVGGPGGNTEQVAGLFWFAEASVEHFWYRLLTSLDSARVAAHLIRLWQGRLWQAAGNEGNLDDRRPGENDSHGACHDELEYVNPTDGPGAEQAIVAEEEEQSVLRCCILARFLGLLLFGHQWAVRANGGNAARPLQGLLRETPRCFGTGVGLDVIGLMTLASRRGRLTLCLPWLCCLLQMLREDPVSRSLPYYRAALVALHALATAPPLAPLHSGTSRSSIAVEKGTPASDDVEVTAASAGAALDSEAKPLARRVHVSLLAQLQHTLILLGEPLAPSRAPHRSVPVQAEDLKVAPLQLRLTSPAQLLALHAFLRDRFAVMWCCAPLSALQRALRLLCHGQPSARHPASHVRQRSTRKITPTLTSATIASPARGGLGSARQRLSTTTAGALGSGSSRLGSPTVSGRGTSPRGELDTRLRAAQQSTFWKQYASLVNAINCMLDPMRLAICADALEHGRVLLEQQLPWVGHAAATQSAQTEALLSATSAAMPAAMARLRSALAALLPVAPPTVIAYAEGELLPVLQLGVRELLELRVAELAMARVQLAKRQVIAEVKRRRELFGRAAPNPLAAAVAASFDSCGVHGGADGKPTRNAGVNFHPATLARNAVAAVQRPGSAAAAAAAAVSRQLETLYTAQQATATAAAAAPLVEGVWQARAVLRLPKGCATKPMAVLMRKAQWAVCTPMNEWRVAVTTARDGHDGETATGRNDRPNTTAGRLCCWEQSKSWWWHRGGVWAEAWQALAELDSQFGAILADALLVVFCDVAASALPVVSFPQPRLVPLGCAALGALLACGAISSAQATTALAEAEAAVAVLDNHAPVNACSLLRREIRRAWKTPPAPHEDVHRELPLSCLTEVTD